jgi:hypothetical protein
MQMFVINVTSKKVYLFTYFLNTKEASVSRIMEGNNKTTCFIQTCVSLIIFLRVLNWGVIFSAGKTVRLGSWTPTKLFDINEIESHVNNYLSGH